MTISSSDKVAAKGAQPLAQPPLTRIYDFQFRPPGEVDIGCLEDTR